MNVVGRFGSLISQGVYSVATPFHPFGGAVDIIVVQQQDGTFRSTPWYVRFGKFQGVLKGAEKMVGISVNGIEADFQMYLDNSGEAYFVKEVDPQSGMTSRLEHSVSDSGIMHLRKEFESSNLGKIERCESDLDRRFYDFQDDDFSPENSQEDSSEQTTNPDQNSEVVLISVDGHILTAPILDDEKDDIELRTPHLHLGSIEGDEFCGGKVGFCQQENPWVDDNNVEVNVVEKEDTDDGVEVEEKTTPLMENDAPSLEQTFSATVSDNQSLQTPVELEDGQSTSLVAEDTMNENPETSDFDGQCSTTDVVEVEKTDSSEEILMPSNAKIDISLCRNELHPGMGNAAAAQAFEKHRVSIENFETSMASIIKNENLVIRCRDKYLSWEKAAPIVLAMAAFDLDLPIDSEDTIRVEEEEEEEVKPIEDETGSETPTTPTSSGRRWRLWRIPFRRVKTLEHQISNSSSEDVFVDPEPLQHFQSEPTLELTSAMSEQFNSPHKQIIRTNVPTTEQIASLNLKEGQNMITFSFSTRVLGKQQVDAHIYLWMWNAKIVISDVDGTITKSDVLGQFMPLVGKDWTQSGVARLFSAIKENGYQLLFLSARAIVQAYLTRSFLLNLKQDGKALPSGPVVISPDGLFPSLYREVIRRAPHEFKIGCLEDIKALFPSDYNPFYAGFGNRDTDEISYMKIGIPKGKIFIINPKGEVANSHRIDVKSYTSLHTLVNDMFPPTSLVEQEDYNSWNFWKMPFPEIDC